MARAMLLANLVFAVLFMRSCSVNGQVQRFSLNGQTYPNHGLVLREDIGETDTSDLDLNNGLQCISFSGCCVSPVPGSQRGEFFFPGSANQVPILTNIGSGGYYRSRAADRIILNRQSPDGTTTGIFECRIRTDSSQTEYQIFYIGVYDAGAGSPTFSGVTLSGDSKTLTCTSTGGPATTLIWRRNCIILQQNDTNYVQNQVVTNTITVTYENTLEINNTFTDGVYTCSVRNSRGYDSSSVGVGTDYSSPLPITVSITSSSSTPMAGQSFTLTCQATTALTSPSYQWFDNSGGMIGSGSTLTLNPLLESSSGEYACQVTAGSGADQRFGCGVTRVDVQVPSLTVTVNNAENAVAGQSHTLSCSVTGSNLESATIMYTWRFGANVLQGPSTSNMYNIAMVQVGNAGDVYTCEVTVTVSYWDVSVSFGDSGSGTLSVTIIPGLPVCPERWSQKSLSSLTLSWQPPLQPDGDITNYFLELVSFDNSTVLQSASVSDRLNYTFMGVSIGAGVPYHVRVYTVNEGIRGGYCSTTDFGDQLAPPSNILSDLASSYDSDSSSVLLTWTVLPLDQTKGFITLSISFGPLVSTSPRKRQTSGESTECSQSPCQVSYDKGRVRISGIASRKVHFVFVIPENEEGERGNETAFSIPATTQPSNISECTCPQFTYPLFEPCDSVASSNNSAAVSGMAAVIVVLVLLLLLSVIVIVVQHVKFRHKKLPSAVTYSQEGEKTEIMTSQCEAYEVMKMKEQPRRAGHTTTAATGPDATYEEVGEGLVSGQRRGQEAGATPQQEQQVYDEVSHGTE